MQGAKDKIIQVKNLYRDYQVAEKKGTFLSYLFHRNYRTVQAVNNISFDIYTGETVGFIGPNGAGKSTTIKMLTGILTPTAGEISVFGRDPYKYRKENASNLGVVFGQKSQLWWDLPVVDTYVLLKKIYRIPDEKYQKNLDYYTKALDMQSFIKQPVRQLSLGQRMRAEICAALLHDPKVLLLDEPTIGLDILVKKQIREMIRKINQEKEVTILLTTHDLKDIEEVCDRIILINHGQIVVDGKLEVVKEKFNGCNSIVFKSDMSFKNNINIKGIERWEVMQDAFIAFYRSAECSAADIIEKVIEQYKVNDIEMRSPTIEDIVERYYK